MDFKKILTHPGSAHKDDFLACSVLIYKHGLPVVRREPTPEDVEDPATLVVDVGGSHNPERGNFDHHHFPPHHEPVCALSLVLKDLGLYDDAKRFCDWLETAEWFDSRGPVSTARWLGIDRNVMNQLNSPIDVSMLRRFAAASELGPEDPLWQIMRLIGEDLVVFVETQRERVAYISEHTEFWSIKGTDGKLEALFMPRTEPLPDDPASGLPRYVEKAGRTETVVAMVYPDRRGPGYGLSRFRDDPRMDFTRLSDLEDVHFTHARGFVAKTTATDPVRLRELLAAACLETEA